MFPNSYFSADYFPADYWPPITITQEVVQGVGGRTVSRIYEPSRKKIYEELRRSREALEKADEQIEQFDEPEITPIEYLKLEEDLALAEEQVRKRLAKHDIAGQLPKKSLAGFVEAIRFGEDLGEMAEEDMEQILLILLIDEITDD